MPFAVVPTVVFFILYKQNCRALFGKRRVYLRPNKLDLLFKRRRIIVTTCNDVVAKDLEDAFCDVGLKSRHLTWKSGT